MGLLDNLGKLGGVFGLAGSIFGSSSAAKAQRQANAMNYKINLENRDWSERMANTEWQRGTADMLQAGINPMLAVSQGGASTPSNSAATVIPEDAMGRGMQRLGETLMTMTTAAQVKNIEAQARKTNAEAGVIEGTSANVIELSHWQNQKIQKEISKIIIEQNFTQDQAEQLQRMVPLLIEAARQDIDLTKGQIASTAAKTKLDEYAAPSAKAEAEVWEKLGAAGRGANIGANALQQVIAIIRSILK